MKYSNLLTVIFVFKIKIILAIESINEKRGTILNGYNVINEYTAKT